MFETIIVAWVFAYGLSGIGKALQIKDVRTIIVLVVLFYIVAPLAQVLGLI